MAPDAALAPHFKMILQTLLYPAPRPLNLRAMPSPRELTSAWVTLGALLGEAASHRAGHDFGLVDEIAHVHRLDAAVAEPAFAKGHRIKLPELLTKRWKAAHFAALAQSVHRHERLREVLAALAPTPVIVLKGFALAELVYPSPAARSMGDVDVLVPAASLDFALATLTTLGYQKQYPGHPIWDHPDFHERQLVGPMDLDLHQGFIQASRLPIDYADIFARAIPWPALAPNAQLLAPEDAVAYTALRLALGELTPKLSPAIGFLDLREMLRRKGPLWGFGPALDPRAVSVRAHAWHAERHVFVALEAARRVFPSIGPAVDATGTNLSTRLTTLLRRAIVDRAVPPGLTNPTRAESLFRKGLLLRPSDRLRFAVAELSRRANQ